MRANRSTLVKLCLLTALAVPVQRAASATVAPAAATGALSTVTTRTAASQLIAQAASEFTFPESLDGADPLVIDGSSSMRAMNAALSEQFQTRYSNTTVETNENGTDVALERLLNGEINLAAIGRPLTEAEIDAGLTAIPIAREKIALIISSKNAFKGDISFEQFGQIFRGKITNWSELGGESRPLRFIDRPEFSDTRKAFRPYPVFQSAPFTTGATAEPVSEDETEAVIKALGNDGIGYAIAHQVLGKSDVKIISMHQTLPDDPRYPFSQPRNYVYRGEPSPAVQGFLAVATSPEGVATVADVQATEAAAAADLEGPAPTVTSPDGDLVARTNEDNLAIIEDADGKLIAGPLAGAGGAVTALAFSEDGQILATGTNTGKVRYWGIDGEPQGDAFTAVLGEDNGITELRFVDDDQLFVAGSQGRQGLWGLDGRSYGEAGADGADVAASAAPGESPADAGAAAGEKFPLWWLLLPLLGLLGTGLWLLGKRRSQATPEPRRQTSPTATVPPPAGDPESDRAVSNRAQSVISTDRVIDESRAVQTPPESPVPLAPLPVGLPGVEDSATVSRQAAVDLESTDLESPDLEGTNLDLLTPGTALGGAALGGIAVAAAGLDASLESVPDDDDEEYDDNLDLTLDDAPDPPSTTIAAAVPADMAAPDEPEDLWATAPADELERQPQPEPDLFETLEPTRDTIIAEMTTVPDIEPTRETIISEGAVIFGGVAAASVAAMQSAEATEKTMTAAPATTASPSMDQNHTMNNFSDRGNLTPAELASVDDGLSDLPDGYGESRIVLLPRDPKWAYAYWDIAYEHKDALRRQGGERLMLRLYDVTDIDHSQGQAAHGMQQYDCHEMARSWYLEIPVSDRDYIAEIGYLTTDDRWLLLSRSASVRVPPIYPSNWVNDQFATIGWQDSLVGRTFGNLGRPGTQPDAADSPTTAETPPIYDALWEMTQSQAATWVAGSLFGSMHQVSEQMPPAALSASGMASGIGMGLSALNVSGLNVSGLNMSGVGFGERKRNFWLVADAELIVYGATEPDATVIIGDRVIPLNPDGTFRFHMAFPDGNIDYPIRAIAVDGEQSRSITMTFQRNTPERNTNTKADAKDEWF
ncbi:MAG: DUF4912 domain-containing protein [Phormidesmis sp. RL_2_1]|nr:DUF4912 domain-containing protein [Phormidesmis sp. RL_2_1]